MQDPNPLPWGALDRFQAHFIVRKEAGAGFGNYVAKTKLTDIPDRFLRAVGRDQPLHGPEYCGAPVRSRRRRARCSPGPARRCQRRRER